MTGSERTGPVRTLVEEPTTPEEVPIQPTGMTRYATALAHELSHIRENDAYEALPIFETLAEANPVRVLVFGSPAEAVTVQQAIAHGLARPETDIAVQCVQPADSSAREQLMAVDPASLDLLVISETAYIGHPDETMRADGYQQLAELLLNGHRALAKTGGLMLPLSTSTERHVTQAHGFRHHFIAHGDVLAQTALQPPHNPELVLWEKTDVLLTPENRRLIRAFDFKVNNLITAVVNTVGTFDASLELETESDTYTKDLKNYRERCFKRRRLIKDVLPLFRDHPRREMRQLGALVERCQIEFNGILQDINDLYIAMTVEPESKKSERERLVQDILDRQVIMRPYMHQIQEHPVYDAYHATLPEEERNQIIIEDEGASV